VEGVRSTVKWLSPEQVREDLSGLPPATGYALVVKPLRYRDRPHLAAYTEFEERRITIQVPEPFFPFGEIVPYAAKRVAAKGMRFAWISEGLTFRKPREVLRFLWCHEWYHWYLKEVLGRKSHAETACDRFALHNYLRDTVTLTDAAEALRRPKLDLWEPEPSAAPARAARSRLPAPEPLRLDI
jgi:hypothetical protein